MGAGGERYSGDGGQEGRGEGLRGGEDQPELTYKNTTRKPVTLYAKQKLKGMFY